MGLIEDGVKNVERICANEIVTEDPYQNEIPLDMTIRRKRDILTGSDLCDRNASERIGKILISIGCKNWLKVVRS